MLRNEGVKRVAASLYRLAKGITGACIAQWKHACASDLTKRMMHNTALYQMAGILARLVKGDLYARVIKWKLEVKKGLREKGDRVREAALK